MIKMIALCMAAVMSLALLAGCTSADPNNPYGQEPAEGNPGATTAETAAVQINEQARSHIDETQKAQQIRYCWTFSS